MVIVRCFCAFHAVRMGVFCEYVHLRLYVWLSFVCISVFFVGGLSVRTVAVHF